MQPHKRGQIYFFGFCFCPHPNISPPLASFLLIYNLKRETSDLWHIIDTVSHIHLALCRKINRSVLPSEFVILYCLIISDCKGFEEIVTDFNSGEMMGYGRYEHIFILYFNMLRLR